MWTDGLYRIAHLMREGHVTNQLQLMSTAYTALQGAMKAQGAGLTRHADQLAGLAAELVAVAEAEPFQPPAAEPMRDRAVILSLVAGSIDGALRRAGRAA